MDHLFVAYTKYVIIAVAALMVPATIEARRAARLIAGRTIIEYGTFAKLVCALLVLVAALFALALARVDRASFLVRLGMFAMLGLPVTILVIESFGKKVVIEADNVERSYFGVARKAWHRSEISRVAYDVIWRMYRVYFNDGSTLWLSDMMRGSSQVALTLNEKKA